MKDRISFENLAVEFAIASSKRSEDPYKKVGAAILNKEGRLLSIGYNGLQSKQEINHDFWSNREERRKYVIHAETNALSCITRYDQPYLLASTLLPCSSCAINIASYNIRKVIYLEEYILDEKAYDIFKFYNIELIKYNK
jgi:dCMP deaminase